LANDILTRPDSELARVWCEMNGLHVHSVMESHWEILQADSESKGCIV